MPAAFRNYCNVFCEWGAPSALKLTARSLLIPEERRGHRPRLQLGGELPAPFAYDVANHPRRTHAHFHYATVAIGSCLFADDTAWRACAAATCCALPKNR